MKFFVRLAAFVAISFAGAFLTSSPVFAQATCTTATVNQCNVCQGNQICRDLGAINGGVQCTTEVGQCGATQGNTCNSTTKNSCGVCPDASQYCQEQFTGGVTYKCLDVPGFCGVTNSQTCNGTTVGTCNGCSNNQTCSQDTGIGGTITYSCKSVAGSCGATQTNTCNASTVGSCSVCPGGQKCLNKGSAGIGCFADNTCTANSESLCCPTDYSDDASACPFSADRSTTCCKRTGFGQYDLKPKVVCSLNSAAFELCKQAATPADEAECHKCFDTGKLWTAFGCVQTSAEGIVTSFLRIGLGIAGGFVLLSILYGAFLLTTSSGDPKRVQEGQEMVTSAIMGLFFVIFSVIILQFIGVSLLKIPGFGT